MALTSRDIVEAEAHYQKTCYCSYTRDSSPMYKYDQQESLKDPYCVAETEAYNMLYLHIRNDLFLSPAVIK